MPQGAPPGPHGPVKPKKNRKARGPKIAHGLERLANQQIRQAQAPVLAQIAQERAANLARARAQMGFAKAAAAIMAQAAPAVQQGYGNAADATAGYAKGLSAPVQGALEQNAQANNAFLARLGTPQGALQQAPDVGGIAYGTQGYIPSQALQREGAAWGAAAQLAPGHLLAQGQQQSAGILANNPTITQLQQELARIAAQRPEVYQRLVAARDEQRARQVAQYQAQQRIQISQQNAETSRMNAEESRRYHNLSIQMRQQDLALKYQKDAEAVARAIREGNRPYVELSKIYGYLVDHDGDPILNKKGKRIPIKESAPGKGGLGSHYPQVNPSGGAGGAVRLPKTFQATHDTDGLPGYSQAIDISGKPGANVRFPRGGVVRYVHMIPWDGTKRVGGMTVYIDTPNGSYFLTHFGKLFVKDGQRIKPGQIIGTIGRVPHGWWGPHIHMGYNPLGDAPAGAVGPIG